MAQEIDVSVLLIAYNQIDLIEGALQSAQMQQGAGNIEIIVHDDMSTDGTRDYIMDAASRDPRIRPIFANSNLASNAVVRRPLELARGRYVTLLDADDYWTAPDKLARQRRILDDDASLAGCFYNAWVRQGGGTGPMPAGTPLWTASSQKRRTGHVAMWEGNPFAAATGMLRRSALSALNAEWYDRFFLTDWPLYVTAAMHGDLLFVDEPVAVYRLHEASTYSGRSLQERLERMAEFYRYSAQGLAPHAPAGVNPQAEAARGAGYFYGDLAQHHLDQDELPAALTCLWHSALTGSVKRSIGWRRWSGLLGRALSVRRAA